MSGLRERKRAATSQAIVDAAMTLLRERRFSEVSVDEIAAAAGVARRTFFRYFPTKEDVLLDRRRIDRESIITGVRARAPEEDDVGLVMRVLAETQRRAFAMFGSEHQPELHRLTHREPDLAARSWLLMEEVRDIIVTGLVDPEATSADLLRARLLASACIMVVDAGITTWIEGGMRADLGAILSEGAEHLRRGFSDDRPEPATRRSASRAAGSSAPGATAATAATRRLRAKRARPGPIERP